MPLIDLIAGARPNLMKIAPIIAAPLSRFHSSNVSLEIFPSTRARRIFVSGLDS